jgi:hypothetical protein
LSTVFLKATFSKSCPFSQNFHSTPSCDQVIPAIQLVIIGSDFKAGVHNLAAENYGDFLPVFFSNIIMERRLGNHRIL